MRGVFIQGKISDIMAQTPQALRASPHMNPEILALETRREGVGRRRVNPIHYMRHYRRSERPSRPGRSSNKSGWYGLLGKRLRI